MIGGGSTVIVHPTLKFAPITATVIGDTTVVTGVAGKILRVIGYAFVSVLGVLVTFKDTPSGVTRATFDLSAGSRVSYPGSTIGPAWETAVGQGIAVNLSLATGVRGHLTYIEL